MKIEWLGEHRDFVMHMVQSRNAYANSYKVEREMGCSVRLSPLQVQILEYIIEHEGSNDNMATIAASLGITPASFTRVIARLEEKGVVEKYHTKNDKKSIVLYASEKGHKVYSDYSAFAYEVLYKSIFEILDRIPKEYIDDFSRIFSLTAKYHEDAEKDGGRTSSVRTLE